MSKISQDEIKWILNMDAKGIQSEIAKVSAGTKVMTAENGKLKRELKETEKIMNQSASAMQRMEENGKKNTVEYRRASESFNSASREVKQFKTEIDANNKKIDENKNKIAELNKSMKLGDMTMNQLRNRARDLAKQLNSTSQAAEPEAYKALQKEQGAVVARMNEVRNSGKGLMDNMTAIPGPVGMAASAMKGLGTAMKALAANPIGVVIMALVAVFMAFKKAISSSEDASTKFQMILAPLKALMDALLNVVQKLVGTFLDLTLAVMGWITKAMEYLPWVGKHMETLNEKARDAIKLEKDKLALKVREREALVENAEREKEIAKLRYEATERDKYTNEEIIEKLDQAIQLEKEITEENIAQAKESLRLLLIEAERAENNEEINNQIAQQRAGIIQLEADYYISTRRMARERFTRYREMQSEDERAAKEAIDRQISKLDTILKKETIMLKNKLANDLISQEEYDKQLEFKQLEALNNKLAVAGIEESARLQIEEQILDFKVKAMEKEKEFERERAELAKSWATRFLSQQAQDLATLEGKYEEEFNQLVEQWNKKLITEEEFLTLRDNLYAERDERLSTMRKTQRELDAEQELAELLLKQQEEELTLKQAYASKLISKEEYDSALLATEKRYTDLSLNIENLSASQRIALQQKVLDATIDTEEQISLKQQEEQQRRAEMFEGFSTQIGSMLVGVVSGNEDLVKSSLKAIINMALDALEAQITMSIASATAQAMAQPDSVATFGTAGLARAAILTGLIKGAFAGVKAIVNKALSSSGKTGGKTGGNLGRGTSDGESGARVVRGKESGGFIDVEREQDGKRYKALLKPGKRGYVSTPTVIVGDGPAGKSEEWVASNDALKNPSIAPIIALLDEAQRAGNIRTVDINQIMRNRMAGFESGGFAYSDKQAKQSKQTIDSDIRNDMSDNSDLLKEVKDLLKNLKTHGVKAPVVLSELQRKQELLSNSQKIGSKR